MMNVVVYKTSNLAYNQEVSGSIPDLAETPKSFYGGKGGRGPRAKAFEKAQLSNLYLNFSIESSKYQ